MQTAYCSCDRVTPHIGRPVNMVREFEHWWDSLYRASTGASLTLALPLSAHVLLRRQWRSREASRPILPSQLSQRTFAATDKPQLPARAHQANLEHSTVAGLDSLRLVNKANERAGDIQFTPGVQLLPANLQDPHELSAHRGIVVSDLHSPPTLIYVISR